MSETVYFRKCTSCKKEIGWSAKYYTCNVSTCNRKRTSLTFCSVSCWDAHLPIVRHRESWSEERKSPKNYAVMIEEERAEEEAHQKKLDRDRHLREEEARKSAAVPPASSAAKVVLRRKSEA